MSSKWTRRLVLVASAALLGATFLFGTATALQSGATRAGSSDGLFRAKTVEQVAMRMLADEASGATIDDHYLATISPWISDKPAEALTKGALAVNLLNTYGLRRHR